MKKSGIFLVQQFYRLEIKRRSERLKKIGRIEEDRGNRRKSRICSFGNMLKLADTQIMFITIDDQNFH